MTPLDGAQIHRPQVTARGKSFGVVEWYRRGEHARVEETLPQIMAAGASYLRTHISWAEYLSPGGEAWYDWLLPKLAQAAEFLPCVHFTPPSMSRTGHASGAPICLKDYADFVDHLLTRHGRHFRDIELWNEPNNLLDWDWRQDLDWQLFCEMMGNAAYWVKRRGWRAVLAGPAPFDANWFDLMGQRGLLELISVAGFHGFPGTWDSEQGIWLGWDRHLGEMRRILDRYNPKAEIWITETGYSTWHHGEIAQARYFKAALDAPAERMYWYGWNDIPADVAVQEGLWFDARHYHLGLNTELNRPKLLARLLTEGGPVRVDDFIAGTELAKPALRCAAKPLVITGGAGFVGCNLADSYLAGGEDVIVLDNLSRPGVEQNLDWLRASHGARLHVDLADIRNASAIRSAIGDARAVIHLAGQTAVTTSLLDPVEDFEVNARGTLNVIEAIRRSALQIPLVFASTNKVYGSLEDVAMHEMPDHYVPAERSIRDHGIDETRPLDFCTPYGCSKGVADQYVLDYAKSFDVPSAVLRMSCIYGPRQFGTEDQGWVAHFLIRALNGLPISIYGDGKQVRDILHVHDAVRAYRQVLHSIDTLRGSAFNLGGGPANAISLRMLLQRIEQLTGTTPLFSTSDRRAGDQLYFVADTRRLQRQLGWQPTIGWEQGVGDLSQWLTEHRVGPVRERLPQPV